MRVCPHVTHQTECILLNNVVTLNNIENYKMKKIVLFAALIICCVLQISAQTFPMQKGITWHYKGYGQSYRNENFDTTIFVSYSISIIDTFSVGKAKVAVFDHFFNGVFDQLEKQYPEDIPEKELIEEIDSTDMEIDSAQVQYEAPEELTGQRIIAIVKDASGNYFLFYADSKDELIKTLKKYPSNKWADNGGENILRPQMKKGMDMLRESDGGKTPHWHVWFVQNITDAENAKRLIENAPANKSAKNYTLMYNTGPDTSYKDFISGIGFTRYVYHHHGTTTNVELNMVKMEMPK